ncbi:MAG: cytochrome c3 family protein, partial [Desulfuromonas sp.]
MLNASGKQRILLGVSMLVGVMLLVLCQVSPGEAAKRSFAKKNCIDCHGDFAKEYLSKKNVHQVVKENKCEECHLPHGIVPKLLLKESGDKICLRCHSEESIGLDQPQVHTALKRGQCSTCHDPHASDNKFLLSSGGNDICFGCHDQAPFTRKVVHGVLQEDGCLACHKAHASAEKNLL